MKFVTHQTTLHLSFKIKCCVDHLRPPEKADISCGGAPTGGHPVGAPYRTAQNAPVLRYHQTNTQWPTNEQAGTEPMVYGARSYPRFVTRRDSKMSNEN